MEKRTISIVIASAVTFIFLFFAVRPGIFNMIGYTISLLVFSEYSPENLKYGKLIIYFVDISFGFFCFGLLTA